jgi:CheY-like chemotaxis protein/rubrerythrin
VKEIITWLRDIEHQAIEMYLKAASLYQNDHNLKKFLEHTAEDESWHYHVMGSASVFLESEPDIVPAVSVDEEIKNKITKQIEDINNGLDHKTIPREELIDKIVELELSEWNDLFLYAVNFLKERTTEFKYPAARIQAHIKEIEYFLETVEGRPQALLKIKALPPVWIENILVVDDEEMITKLINSLLYRSGNIDIAHNGKDALEMMGNKYYKLIISDIDMPVMDGISFYNEAVSRYPTANHKFLFMTGDLTPERQTFLKDNQLKYLAKPMNISVLRQEAAKIIISQ